MARLSEKHIPIRGNSGHFKLPVHEKFFDEDTAFPKNHCFDSLKESIEPWYKSLSEHTSNEHVQEYLEKKIPHIPTLSKKEDCYYLSGLSHWEITWSQMDNGFMRYLSIGRDIGTLHAKADAIGEFISYSTIPESILKNFNTNPLSTWSDGIRVQVYQEHNIHKLPESLFLREWGMRYVNKCLRTLLYQ